MTPPRENKMISIIPSINIAILRDASDTKISISSYGGKEKGKRKEPQEDGEEDMWGIKKKGDLWHCSITGEYLEEHPFLAKKSTE